MGTSMNNVLGFDMGASISNGSTTTPNGISKAREDVTCLVSFAFINLIGALLNPNFVEKYLHLNGCIMQ